MKRQMRVSRVFKLVRRFQNFPHLLTRKLVLKLFSIGFFFTFHGILTAQVISPFTSVFSTDAKGNIAIVGNTLITYPSGGTSGSAQVGGSYQNNSYKLIQVDIDGNTSITNSSSANFTLPSGGSMLWAELYWGESL
jgi:hypothetical protein